MQSGPADERPSCDEIEALLAAGRAGEAAALGAQRIDAGEDDPALFAAFAEALLLNGRAADAVRVARAVARDATASVDVLLRAAATLVLALVREGDADSLRAARSLLDRQLTVVADRLDAVAGRMHHAQGVMLLHDGDAARSRVALLHALAAFDAGDARWRAAAVVDTLGMAHARMGDDLRAREYYDRSVAQKVASGDRLGQSISRGNRARLMLRNGAADAALEDFRTSHRLAADCGDRLGEVVALDGCGLALLELGHLDQAEECFQRALALATERKLVRQQALCMKDLALVHERRGRFDDALDAISLATDRFLASGNREGAGFCRTVWGRILFRADDVAGARRILGLSVQDLRATGRQDLLVDALIWRAEALAADSPDDARSALDEAEAIARSEAVRGAPGEIDRLRTLLDGHRRWDRLVIRNPLGLGRETREYLLLERLGRGGHGEAWRALDVGTGGPVVVKRIGLPDESAGRRDAVERVRTEFEAAMRVDHPGVVRVLAFERRADLLHIAMELLPGGDLLDRLRAGGPPAQELALRWMREIAAGLGALHAAGILHGDVKPGNVALGADGRAVLIDFGIARLDVTCDSPSTTIAGSYHYMAPEMVVTGRTDPRSDLFGLGVTGIELLTGENPFRRATEAGPVTDYLDLARLPARFDLAVEDILWPEAVPAPVRSALLRAVRREPAARFDSAKAFIAALDADA